MSVKAPGSAGADVTREHGGVPWRGPGGVRAASRAARKEAAAGACPPSSSLLTLRRFEQPSAARAVWQVATTFLPYLATMALMYLMMRQRLPWWTTLPLAVLAAGFMVRLFIFMHDCIHS